MKRHFLLLQGVCSPFFAALADELTQAGHMVRKLHFNGGDTVYWGWRAADTYRKRVEGLPDFLNQYYRRCGITDIVLFGDSRPVHQVAITVAHQLGIRIHVTEEGYFRPYWVTLERDGVNAHSRLPKDPAWYREVGRSLPDYSDGQAFASSFFIRAWHDVHYHIRSVVNPLLYRGYRTHAQMTAFSEYIGYLRRLPRLGRYKDQDASRIRDLIVTGKRFFLLPLQLNGDAQIREHSSFSDMEHVMHTVMQSFASHASHDTILVIKNHPLDMWMLLYPQIVPRLIRQYGLEGRVLYLETGDMQALLTHASGVVTVNSTAGLQAVIEGRAVITLANPIYNMKGMTSQSGLDDFWHTDELPDAQLVRCFRNTVIHTTQINGGFYSSQGIVLAVRNIVGPLTADQSALEQLL